ncbi:MAG TPA: pH regulation protein F [Thermococcus paralvinellae]|uniref:pH regulation protein F n=1 Tax=Thermococcus paralvinellae TaxID=582419 RepID=A0A832ZFY3_9EURY|nr:pH regulation protein F [Thermococcus paralvinellae]
MFEFEDAILLVIAAHILTGMIYALRLLLGPSIVDSILAADCISIDAGMVLLLIALYYRNSMIALGALFLFLWAFALDVFASKYLVKGEVGI